MSGAAIAGSVLAPIVGGIVGQEASRGDRNRSKDELYNAINAIQAAMPPDPESQKVYFEQLRQQGVLTPEMEQAINLGPSAMEGVSTDPRLRSAQMAALQQLQDVGKNGMTLQDKADLQKMQGDNAAIERGQRDAIAQNMQSRGMAGSGMELAQKLASQQGAADRNASQGLGIAANAQRNALQAVMQGGQLAGSIQGQDFNRQAQIAAAKDAIARFNAQNQQMVAAANTNRSNDAQKYNLGEQQRIADTNTQMGNQQEINNRVNIPQQAYQNQLGKAQAMAGQYQGLSNFYGNRAQNTAQMYTGIGQAAGQGAAAYGQHQDYQDYLNRKYPQE